MKYTNQRVAILDYLKNKPNHPTVEDIFKEVKLSLPRITRATVYKNLKILTENSLIREVNVKGVSRYEAKMEPHHHMICKKCEKIIDFKSKDLINYALKIVENQKEFIINNAETTFFGICSNCGSI